MTVKPLPGRVVDRMAIHYIEAFLPAPDAVRSSVGHAASMDRMLDIASKERGFVEEDVVVVDRSPVDAQD
jgi:hypothetical protein